MHRGLCYVESKFKKHLFFAFLPFLLNFRKFCPHALKGQKPLAQGIALGNYGRKTVAL